MLLSSLQTALATSLCDDLGFDHYCPVACDACPGMASAKFKENYKTATHAHSHFDIDWLDTDSG